ncbi:valine--tRNA ligase [Mycoplasma sp. 3341]|uniref:valine--tRNA ligase n=1 Tax=Mycoplasma sp. 3341 TaxID=3447506 RepID=UPI003F65E149
MESYSKKKTFLQAIRLGQISQNKQSIDVNDINFSLYPNQILSIINTNKNTQNAIFDMLIASRKSKNNNLGFLVFNDNFIFSKTSLKQQWKNYRHFLGWGFRDAWNNTDTKTKLIDYLYQYFIDSDTHKFNSEDFLKDWKNVLVEYQTALSINRKQIEVEYYNDLEELFNSFFSTLNTSTAQLKQNNTEYLTEFFNLANDFLIQHLNLITKTEKNIIETYVSYQERYREGKLFLNYQEINNLRQERNDFISEHTSNDDSDNYKTNVDQLLKLVKTKKTNNKQAKHVVLKFISDLKIKVKFYKNKYLETTKNLEAFIYFYKKYYANKLMLKILLFHYRLITRLSPQNLELLLLEINAKLNAAGALVLFYRNNSQRKDLIKNIKKQVEDVVSLSFKYFKSDYKSQQKDYYANFFSRLSNLFNISGLISSNEKVNFSTKDRLKLRRYDFLLNELNLNNRWNRETTLKEISFKEKQIENQLFLVKNNVRKQANQFNNLIKNFNSEILKINRLQPSLPWLLDIKPKAKYLNYLDDKLKQYHLDLNKLLNVITYKSEVSSSSVLLFLFKQYLYNVLSVYDLKAHILERSVANLDETTIAKIRVANIFNKNPKVIIIGSEINKFSTETKDWILKEINKYVFEKSAMAIYFLNDMNIAANFSTHLFIMHDNMVVESGKTSSLTQNPVHAITKQLINNQKVIFQNEPNKQVQLFKIDENHSVYCSINEFVAWTSQNSEIKVTKKSKTKNIVDNSILKDTLIIDLANSKYERKEMDKNFDHKIVEKNRYQKWLDKKTFQKHDEAKRPFTIILPPPNVTGQLHIGHALDTYIQDTIIRYKKLQGYDTLFLPGTDHAGISTQAKVEAMLQEQGKNKHEMGREEFLKVVWEWKDKYSNIIHEQWAKLGLALDYSSERFTLDKEANEAVLKVFIDLYNKGIIYRGTRAISWDPVQMTALSNVEVLSEPIEQKMYYIKYPLQDSNEYLEVATTRIETLPSDVAVAFNPTDVRYQKFLGKNILHPLTKKLIPIISDDYIDPSFGSGVMKVSAHATNDIDIINKNGLEINECINKQGKMTELAGEFAGLDRFEARDKIAQKLADEGYLIKVEKTISNVGLSERSKAPIEILVQPQWFLKMNKMSQNILENIEKEDGVKFYPERFKDVIKQWMENVYDWTISRQLWWGHRIPAWYKGQEIKVSLTKPGEGWVQDEDVLDTWFSSGLAPFVFLGWPQKTEKVQRYFPTQVLVTAYDIIFFWVARMYFMSLEFMNNIPFEHVLIHGLLRDEQGRKMSKSLGNGINPIEVIEQHGSDVLRIALLFNSTPGQDINFGNSKLDTAKLFVNKFWNIARLVNNFEINKSTNSKLDAYDAYIVDRLNKFEEQININMDKYEFTVVYKEIQKFIVNEFSGWYLEFAKFKNKSTVIHKIFKKILILMQPFLPFTTDYLFEQMYNEDLYEAKVPVFDAVKDTTKAEKMIEIITELRKYREQKNISKAKTLYFAIDLKILQEEDLNIISKLANFEYQANEDTLIQASDFKIFVVMDEETKQAEIQRLEKMIEQNQVDIDHASKMLNNPNFMQRAKPEKIVQEQEKLAMFEAKKASYEQELDKLKNK